MIDKITLSKIRLKLMDDIDRIKIDKRIAEQEIISCKREIQGLEEKLEVTEAMMNETFPVSVIQELQEVQDFLIYGPFYTIEKRHSHRRCREFPIVLSNDLKGNKQ